MRTWTLPNGITVEQCGPRRINLFLVWADDEAVGLDETRIRELWPECRDVRSLGPDLFIVDGVAASPVAPTIASPPRASLQDSPVQLAGLALAVARASADPRHIVTALTDLGLARLKECDAERAGNCWKKPSPGHASLAIATARSTPCAASRRPS